MIQLNKIWICIMMSLLLISVVNAREETPNLTVLTEEIGKINITAPNITINQTDFISNVVASGNENTNGWLGISFFYMTGILIFLILTQTTQQTKMRIPLNIIITGLFLWILIGIFFISFGILQTYQFYITILAAFFIFVFIGSIIKDQKSTES